MIHKKEEYPGWRYYGKRFLTSQQFTQFCTAVGLYHSHESELEELERQRLMFPAARLILPEEYAAAIGLIFTIGLENVDIDDKFQALHKLDWALRYSDTSRHTPETPDPDLLHPIDNYWSKVKELILPSSQEFIAWQQYQIQFDYKGRTYSQSTVSNFYHYWQVYEFYKARMELHGFYRSPAPVMIADLGQHIRSLTPILDTISYFQYLYRAKITALFVDANQDDDDLWRLSEEQIEIINASGAQYAQETLQKFSLSEPNLYVGLGGLCRLHEAFELFEKVRLAETIKLDIWRTAELIYYAFGTPTDEISHRLGQIEGHSGDYIELLFPNQRKRTRAKARSILKSLSSEHNHFVPNFPMADGDIDDLLQYLEKTDLAIFEYALQQTNEAFFARHSWRTAEAFVQLKSLASFPESLMKTILFNSGDAAAIREFNDVRNPGMGTLNQIFFQKRFTTLWKHYEPIRHRYSRDANEFGVNLHHHSSLMTSAGNEEAYLATCLSLATCIRNFTSHLVVEDPNLLRGQYVRCIRAITSSTFLIWHTANRQGWIPRS